MFLSMFGGIKKIDSDESDIFLDNKSYEIKSVSNHSYLINVSYRQLMNDVDIIMFLLKNSNDKGKNIFQIIDSINGNEEFKNKIREEYSDPIYKQFKFAVDSPRVFKKPKEIKLSPKFFVSAKYTILIDWDKSIIFKK